MKTYTFAYTPCVEQGYKDSLINPMKFIPSLMHLCAGQGHKHSSRNPLCLSVPGTDIIDRYNLDQF
jgi:hypothetical protein